MNILRHLILACIFSLFFVLWPGFALSQDGNFREKVEKAARWQMENYPESRLQDLYKNFFQDKFGPGHIVADTASAGKYIRMELNSVTVMSQKEYAEITGWEGKFVRVDMAVLKNGLVDYKTFADAFFESAAETTLPSMDEWRLEWRNIENIVKELYPNLPGFADDSRELEEILAGGHYAVHHSKEYESAYKPHYRLFSRKIFDSKLAPVLPF